MVHNYIVLYSDQKSQLSTCDSKTPVLRHKAKKKSSSTRLKRTAKSEVNETCDIVFIGLSKGRLRVIPLSLNPSCVMRLVRRA